MVFGIKSPAATEVPFSSSMTNCSTSAASFWEFKLNGAWRDSDILQVRAHKKVDGSIALLDLDFMFIFRVIDFKSGDKDDDPDGILIQNNGKTLSACSIAFP